MKATLRMFFMQTFQVSYKGVFGDTITHELKPDGKNVPITTQNRTVCFIIDSIGNRSITGLVYI